MLTVPTLVTDAWPSASTTYQTDSAPCVTFVNRTGSCDYGPSSERAYRTDEPDAATAETSIPCPIPS